MSGLYMAAILALYLVSDSRVSVREAQMLVENTPDFLRASAKARCPRAELLWSGEDDFAFQIRNRCARSPSGLIGNYVVDRQTAEVWIGVDRDELVQSNRLKRLQQAVKRNIAGRAQRKQ